MIKQFKDTRGHSDHDAFVEWLEQNPDAFFFNLKSGEILMLHRAGCSHIVFKPEDEVSLTANAKVCSTDRDELEVWARKEHRHKMLRYCSSCNPT